MNESTYPVNKSILHEKTFQTDITLVSTIEQIIHDKIRELREDRYEPRFVLLSEKAYTSLCQAVTNRERHYRNNLNLDLERYRDILVVLDMDATEDIKILRRPCEELVK